MPAEHLQQMLQVTNKSILLSAGMCQLTHFSEQMLLTATRSIASVKQSCSNNYFYVHYSLQITVGAQSFCCNSLAVGGPHQVLCIKLSYN